MFHDNINTDPPCNLGTKGLGLQEKTYYQWLIHYLWYPVPYYVSWDTVHHLKVLRICNHPRFADIGKQSLMAKVQVEENKGNCR